MEPYQGTSLGHLSIHPGEVIEVVGSTDCGLLEGYVRGVNRSGFFPAHCVQEVNIRQKNITNVSISMPPYRNENTDIDKQQMQQPDQYVPSQYNSSTGPRIKKTLVLAIAMLCRTEFIELFLPVEYRMQGQ